MLIYLTKEPQKTSMDERAHVRPALAHRQIRKGIKAAPSHSTTRFAGGCLSDRKRTLPLRTTVRAGLLSAMCEYSHSEHGVTQSIRHGVYNV